MPRKILNVYYKFSDPSTNTFDENVLAGATIFSTPALGDDGVENHGVLKLVGHTDTNGNVSINTDDNLDYIITALYLTEDNLTTTAESSPIVKIGYYELEAYLTQPPFNQPLGSIAYLSSYESTLSTNSPDNPPRIILQLTPEVRASKYFPTNAQISKIPIVNLPSSNIVTEIPRITLTPESDPTTTATSQLNAETKAENNKTLDKNLKSQLAPQARLVNIFNSQKDKIRRKIIPFLISLLLPFGAAVVQGILAKLPLDTIKDLASCPNRAGLLQLIEKRNKLVKQINAIYKTIITLSKIALGLKTTITALRIGIAASSAVPLPAPPGVPVGLAKLEETAKKFNVILNIATVVLATIGTLLGVILVILNSLDALILQCAEDQDVPFEEINNELNDLVNSSTGISNSEVIQQAKLNIAVVEKLEEMIDSQYVVRHYGISRIGFLYC